ncbi:MAG TPA: response regulator [Planctomycetota bacterium]|nr:response regulator [Planctomycetota bacterium]
MTCILLTEDQPDQRTLYHDVLTDAGYTVYDAWSAPEALELYQRYKPDIVVMDIQMPGMDGIEALGKILDKDRKTPVILYSAYPAFKMNFLTWSADAFVEKTGDPQELVDAVKKLSKARGIPIPESKKVEGVAP